MSKKNTPLYAVGDFKVAWFGLNNTEPGATCLLPQYSAAGTSPKIHEWVCVFLFRPSSWNQRVFFVKFLDYINNISVILQSWCKQRHGDCPGTLNRHRHAEQETHLLPRPRCVYTRSSNVLYCGSVRFTYVPISLDQGIIRYNKETKRWRWCSVTVMVMWPYRL